MKAGPVVRRYASALFSIAKEKGQVENFGREIDFLGELFEDKSLRSFLRNPKVGSAEKRKIFLDKIAPHISPNMINFVNLLFDRNRIDVLEGIALAYRKISQASMGMAEGVVESARELSEVERTELEAALSKQLGLKVKLHAQIVPSLIGGVRVTIGHRRLDMSVLSTLEEMKARLLAAPMKK